MFNSLHLKPRLNAHPRKTGFFVFSKQLILLQVCILLLTASNVLASDASNIIQTDQHQFKLNILTEKLDHPWSLAFLPDGRMLVTERPGRLRIVDQHGRLSPPLAGLPNIIATGQGGLMGIALHPDFKNNKRVYFSYVAGKHRRAINTELAYATLDGLTLKDRKTIFIAQPKTNGGRHFGGRLLFDQHGLLYLTLGDRANRESAQQLSNHAGSIVRLTDEGAIPDDNPFINNKNAQAAIFTYGNRNPQGLAQHPQTQTIWSHEHGPQGGDEINIIKAGINYGWPVITHGVNYVIGTKIGEGTAKAGMQQPIYHWTPSIAPSGMAFYNGEKFPQWQGDLFVGALKDRMLVRLKINKQSIIKEERMLINALGRIRDVKIGPDQLLYLLTDSSQGAIVRLEPISIKQ